MTGVATKIKCCQIHLMPGAKDRAARAIMDTMRKNGERVPSGFALEFIGPDFKDIREAYCIHDVATVICKDNTVYVYPMHQVARFKLYEQEVLV